jgi:hypothetical protein
MMGAIPGVQQFGQNLGETIKGSETFQNLMGGINDTMGYYNEQMQPAGDALREYPGNLASAVMDKAVKPVMGAHNDMLGAFNEAVQPVAENTAQNFWDGVLGATAPIAGAYNDALGGVNEAMQPLRDNAIGNLENAAAEGAASPGVTASFQGDLAKGFQNLQDAGLNEVRDAAGAVGDFLMDNTAVGPAVRGDKIAGEPGFGDPNVNNPNVTGQNINTGETVGSVVPAQYTVPPQGAFAEDSGDPNVLGQNLNTGERTDSVLPSVGEIAATYGPLPPGEEFDPQMTTRNFEGASTYPTRRDTTADAGGYTTGGGSGGHLHNYRGPGAETMQKDPGQDVVRDFPKASPPPPPDKPIPDWKKLGFDSWEDYMASFQAYIPPPEEPYPPWGGGWGGGGWGGGWGGGSGGGSQPIDAWYYGGPGRGI